MTAETQHQANRINVTLRVEPGSLGPDGLDHIEGFCQLAQCFFDKQHVGFLQWQVVPRYDKSLPELQYSVNDKLLNDAQADKMLSIIDKNTDDMDQESMEHIANLIDKYLGHQY